MTNSTKPLFDSSSTHNQLRATLRCEMKLRSLVLELHRKIEIQNRDQELFGPNTVAAEAMLDQMADQRPATWMIGEGDPVPGEGQLQVGFSPIPPPSHPEDRQLEIVARLPVRNQRVRCRIYLLEAESLARLWHAKNCGPAGYQAPSFPPGSPYYDLNRRQLLIPGDRKLQQLFRLDSVNCITQMASLPEGGLALLGERGGITVWNPASGVMDNSPHQDEPIASFDVLADGRIASVEMASGRILLWHPRSPEQAVELQPNHPVHKLKVLEGKYVVAGGLDGSGQVFDANTGRELFSKQLFAHRVTAVDGWPGVVEFRGISEAFGVWSACYSLEGKRIQEAEWPGEPSLSPDPAIDPQLVRCFSTQGKVERIYQNEANAAFAVIAQGDERFVYAREPELTTLALDDVLKDCFQPDVLNDFHGGRIVASLPEMEQDVSVDANGYCQLEALTPFHLANGDTSRVTAENLQAQVIFLLAWESLEH